MNLSVLFDLALLILVIRMYLKLNKRITSANDKIHFNGVQITKIMDFHIYDKDGNLKILKEPFKEN